MRMMRPVLLCLVVLGQWLPIPSRAQSGVVSDPGLIDGHPALAMWPVLQGRDTTPADPSGFTVHLIPHANQSAEVTKPAGVWFLLEDPGGYRWFLEGPGLISRNESVVMWGLGNGAQGLRMLSEIVPAGRVVLDPELRVKPQQSIRLYSFASRFLRQVRGRDAQAPVQMPPGRVLALLHDDAADSWVAMSRVVEASVKAPGVFKPTLPPNSATDLFMKVSVKGVLLADEAPNINVVLDAGAAPRRPDLLFHDPGAVYAAWWGVAERRGTIRFDCPGVLPLTQETTLPGGVLQVVEATAAPGGTLTVGFALPAELESSAMTLRLLDGDATLDERPVTDTAGKVVFRNVPAHVVHLVLVAGVWKVTQAVDMTPGGDQTATVAPTPIRVAGTITRCGKPVPATVGFLANSSAYTWAQATAGEDGHYEAVVFHPITLMQIRLPGTSDSLQPLGQAIVRDTVRDFDLPCNSYRVHVTDSTTGQPVPDAKIGVLNQGANAGANVETTTDADGLAKLHPLRPGTVRITARAEGYARASVREDIPEGPVEKQLELELEPAGHGPTVRFLLADGSPAAGARVAAVATDGASLLWDGVCDASGKVDLPDQPGVAALLARHPNAGVYVGLWPPRQQESVTVALPAIGGTRRFLARQGNGAPAAWAGVAVWVNGIRLWESALAWATNANPMCGTAGEYLWAGGPPAGVEVLCWAREARDRFAAGALDGLRVEWNGAGVARLSTAE